MDKRLHRLWKARSSGNTRVSDALCFGHTCAGHFSLVFPTLDLAALQSTLLGTSEGGQLLRQILDRIDRHSVKWPDLSGTVRVGALSTGKLVVHDAMAALTSGETRSRSGP